MPVEDRVASRMAARELSRHGGVDTSFMTITVINKICYIGGSAGRLQGTGGINVDPKQELNKIGDAVRLIKGIDDVVIDARIK